MADVVDISVGDRVPSGTPVYRSGSSLYVKLVDGSLMQVQVKSDEAGGDGQLHALRHASAADLLEPKPVWVMPAERAKPVPFEVLHPTPWKWSGGRLVDANGKALVWAEREGAGWGDSVTLPGSGGGPSVKTAVPRVNALTEASQQLAQILDRLTDGWEADAQGWCNDCLQSTPCDHTVALALLAQIAERSRG